MSRQHVINAGHLSSPATSDCEAKEVLNHLAMTEDIRPIPTQHQDEPEFSSPPSQGPRKLLGMGRVIAILCGKIPVDLAVDERNIIAIQKLSPKAGMLPLTEGFGVVPAVFCGKMGQGRQFQIQSPARENLV